MSASWNDNTIRWYENQGIDQENEENIVFMDHDISSSVANASSVAIADLDNDGNMDVVSSSASLTLGDNIRWHKNNGSGGFTTITIGNTLATYSVATADFDNDEDIDVVGISYSDNSLRWYKNNDSEGFTRHNIYTRGAGVPDAVITADIDGDGNMDVLSATKRDVVRWHKNNGSGGFTLAYTFSNLGEDPSSVAVADINKDGRMDILSASSGNNSIRWHENKVVEEDGEETITFTKHTIFNNADGAISVATADLDGDDDMDVLSAFLTDNIIRWYENKGVIDWSVAFMTHTIYTEATNPRSVTTADIDKDGDLDVVSVGQKDNTIYWHESNASTLNVEKVLPHTTALYPNPTSSGVYLNYATATNTTYGLFDMAGKRLAKFTQSGTAHQLDVSSVSKGTYILKATSGLQVNYYRIVKE